MSRIEKPGACNRQQCRRGEIVKDGGGGPAVEVTAFVAEGGRDGELKDCGLRGGGGGEEPALGEDEAVEARVGWVGGEGFMHGQAACVGRLA